MGHMTILFLTFWGTPHMFPITTVQIYIPSVTNILVTFSAHLRFRQCCRNVQNWSPSQKGQSHYLLPNWPNWSRAWNEFNLVKSKHWVECSWRSYKNVFVQQLQVPFKGFSFAEPWPWRIINHICNYEEMKAKKHNRPEMTLLWVLSVNTPSRKSDPLHSLFWVSISRNKCWTCF